MGLDDINSRIAGEATRVGRNAADVNLVAVSKVQPNERVEAVLELGHRRFGENRVQEAAGKWPEFKTRYKNVVLHLIGPLQTNKTRQAMELFDVIETVDRIKLAKTIARVAEEIGSCPDLYIQVNTGDESQKAGVAVEELPDFIDECRGLQLPIVGLMCIPPIDEEPSLHFALLAKLAKQHGLEKLSMGMSGDFEKAIAQGATSVRVGSAIFGERVKPAG